MNDLFPDYDPQKEKDPKPKQDKKAKAGKFFTVQRENSKVKAEIVSKYFYSWATVLTKGFGLKKIAYIDLFCGPGIYGDGAKSTPILILESAIRHPYIGNALMTYFNDEIPEQVERLKIAINDLEGVENLKYQPEFASERITEDVDKLIEKYKGIPMLLFADPFGYEDISLKLIKSFVQNPYSECVIFFNYSNINRASSVPVLQHKLIPLFGKERTNWLIDQVKNASSGKRAIKIISAFRSALISVIPGCLSLPFRFYDFRNRISHHIIFITKNPLAFKMMKEIMDHESRQTSQGVPLFDYLPKGNKVENEFFGKYSIENLAKELQSRFGGNDMSTQQVYFQHHLNRRYVKRNYQTAINYLKATGRLKIIKRQASKSQLLTINDETIINIQRE
jgi:three-Cys-motif partner protein